MNYIKVSIVNKDTLKLETDALKGDLIDLKALMHVDTTAINDLIQQNKDQVYKLKEEELINKLNTEHLLNLKNANKTNEDIISELKNKLELNEIKLRNELESKHNTEVNKLTKDINDLNNKLENVTKEKDYEYKDIINKYERNISDLNNKIELTKKEKDLEYSNTINLLKNEEVLKQNLFDSKLKQIELDTLKDTHTLNEENRIKIEKLNDELSNLRRERSSLNVKLIGEDLEKWCDNEFNAANLVSNNNVVWYKDNETVAGTKADFIYKVYASEQRLENELLTSVVLEMKSEDPESTSKQNINTILKKLDNDRNKKGLEYAILVSELEIDSSNDLPIKKVNEYGKMFIVRPQYFMTLLNIITAFGLKYKDIILAKEEERLKFKDIEDILIEFESMKDEILNNSIKHINTQLDIISKQSDIISSANTKIQDAVNLILTRHLETVKNKINDFRIDKVTKQFDN